MSFILQPLRKIPNLEISPLRITSLINTLEERAGCCTLDHKKKRTPKHVNGGNTPKGANPACTASLEGQKRYFLKQIYKLIILSGGRPLKMFHWGGALPPCRYVAATPLNSFTHSTSVYLKLKRKHRRKTAN